ncbi:MAG: STAS domain-containing protein [Armatimonadota bacterium]|nr:STAS domain-containing protein [Armatimonadota bacterium]
MPTTRIDASKLDVRVLHRGSGTCVVECDGEIDIASAARLGEVLECASTGAPKQLVLDLSRVTYLDSVGVAQIARLHTDVGSAVEVCIKTRDARTRMLLEMAGLGRSIAP